ncbi:hypothetical protein PAXRUDRAFT_823659 [Paxillus rubicundulus Ve08.2h10]|uniref:Altered inheritance of mitochondria protein 32 n=1 Tax=Paxillus rubicundulus Ve08.2h10 TaxID=930991 RepID=A0A0D0EC22_9AGAM|nr:hypothetical protein PAXRUDRAFT_823659 [Paxillus rubicundulus Ve08.2h10]
MALFCHTLQPLAKTSVRLRRLPSRALSTATSTSDLPGTAAVHRCYVFLHTPQPPSEYPAKYATSVQRKLLVDAMKWAGSVNFSWSEEQTSYPLRPAGEEDKQLFYLTAFSGTRGKLEIPEASLANVEEVGRLLREHVEPPLAKGNLETTPSSSDNIHLYVCTHGARDCRCGDMGGAVARAIRNELHRRRQTNPSDPSSRIRLAEVAHVGGHQYAANVLVYPHGEWLGKVEPDDVAGILDAILAKPVRPTNAEEMPICPSHWRGRMGLGKEEQIELFKRLCG